jgi:hypothetical protein
MLRRILTKHLACLANAKMIPAALLYQQKLTEALPSIYKTVGTRGENTLVSITPWEETRQANKNFSEKPVRFLNYNMGGWEWLKFRSAVL